MRILLIHQYFLEDHDGGGSRWNELSRIWRKSGVEVTVLAGMVHYMAGKPQRYKGKFFATETNKDGINVIRCHVSEQYHVNFLGRLWAYFSFTFSSIWAGIFKANEKYDVILATSPPLFVGITALILSKWKKVPLAFEIRDLWPESAVDTGLLTNKLLIKLAFRFEKSVYQRAMLINVLTPAFKSRLVSVKNVPHSKIIFIPNAADFAMVEEVEKDFDANLFRENIGLKNKFIITYVGAHGVANHLIQIIQAADLLRDTDVCFLLIGDGMQKIMLVEEVKKRKLPNIRFVDQVAKKDVFKYILASDMGMSVLKKAETFKTVYSNKTFDYFSCKKPVLMAIDGVSRELVEVAKAGAYLEPENPADFNLKIREYLANPQKLRLHGVNGYNYAKAHFDREVLAKQYLEEIKKAVRL